MEQEQVSKQMKSIAYPIAAIAGTGLFLGTAALALGWLQVGVWIGPVGPNASVISGVVPASQETATNVAMRSATGNSPILSSTDTDVDPLVQQSTAPTQIAANSSPARLNVTPNPGG